MSAIVGWVLLVVLCTASGSLTGKREATSAQLTAGEAGRASTLVAPAGLTAPDIETVVFGRPGAGRLPATTIAAVRSDLALALSRVPGVDTIAAPVLSADGSTALVAVTMKTDDVDADVLRQALGRVDARHPGLDVGVSGSAVIEADINGRLGADFTTALVLSLPITILILLLALGALLAAGVPVLLGACSVLAAVGL